MRLAVISDIHGNAFALERALEDTAARNIHQIVCLGDAIQGGPQPAEVAEILRSRKIPTVMGNADAYLLTGVETADEGFTDDRLKQLAEVRRWSLDQLSESQREFMLGFSPTLTVDLPTGQLLCFHGSPTSFDHILLPDLEAEEPELMAEIFESLGSMDSEYFCGGHTHIQFIRHIGRKFFFNPGSIGVAYRHGQPADNFKLDPWAEYAILDSTEKGLGLEFRRVPFDAGALIEIYRASGRPYPEKAAREYS